VNAERSGVFELQAEVVQGRPTYKKRGAEEYLCYNTKGYWMVGPDTSKAEGWWIVKSAAMTPGAITEAWQTHDGSAWADVRAAKIVKRAAFEAVVAAAAAARREREAAAEAAEAAWRRRQCEAGVSHIGRSEAAERGLRFPLRCHTEEFYAHDRGEYGWECCNCWDRSSTFCCGVGGCDDDIPCGHTTEGWRRLAAEAAPLQINYRYVGQGANSDLK
jgi:hypothetical protein